MEMKGTHTMPDGTVMTGSIHNKDSVPVKETKNKKKIKMIKRPKGSSY